MAGTLAANAKAGGRTLVVCATSGEKGVTHLTRPMTARALARRRKRELHRACAVLRVERSCVCHVPDGRVAQHVQTFNRAITRSLQRFTPDVVVGFGPCGITGHKDHIAAGEIARAIAKKLHLPFAAAVLSPKLQHDAKRFLASRRRSPHYNNVPRFVQPNLTFRINATVKRRALRCHASQMDNGKLFTGFPKYVVEGLLKREYFRIWKTA